MKRLIIVFLAIMPLFATAQQHVKKKHKAFYPHISLNYNVQNIPFPDPNLSILNPAIYRSNFFGSEFGFSILPKNKTGFFFSYNNKLVAELGVREIYYLFNSDIGNNITDYTISSGFFGSLDIGKQVFSDNNSQLIAGIRIADKFIAGTDPLLQAPKFIDYENEGFHIVSGIFGEYKRKLGKTYSLDVKLALSQSVYNIWAIGDNTNDVVYSHPFFIDISTHLFHKSGLYIKVENTTLISYGIIDSLYRFSLGIGYRF